MSAARATELLEKCQEWEAFLALTRVMDSSALETSAYNRLHSACSRLAGKASVTREELILESGLSFFAECAEPDLALMCLVRQNILKPLDQQPFHFSINRQADGELRMGWTPLLEQPYRFFVAGAVVSRGKRT